VPERVSENTSGDDLIHLGPFRSAGVLDTCIEALGRIFPLKRCAGDGETCFYGQMGRCAPCMGMGEEEYRRGVVDEVVALLRGEGGEEHLVALVKERQRLAAGLEFEAAARLRDLISGIERVRLSRAVVSAEGVQAVVAPSTEPGVIEVFILQSGRLISHRGFEPNDATGLTRFAGEALARPATNGSNREGSNEARIVAAYLRRRSTVVEAVRLKEAQDLLKVAERVAEDAGEGTAPLAE
jgi:excinuclease UvrABC nuclease subunit